MKKIITLSMICIFLFACTKTTTLEEYKKNSDKIIKDMNSLSSKLNEEQNSVGGTKEKYVKDQIKIIKDSYSNLIKLKAPKAYFEMEKEYDEKLQKVINFYQKFGLEFSKSIDQKETSADFKKAYEEIIVVSNDLIQIQEKIDEEVKKNIENKVRK